MKIKICKYCGEEFSDIDFPAQFDRMITCGKIECMQQRRLERYGINHNIKKKDISPHY